jgi:hypothetical protein
MSHGSSSCVASVVLLVCYFATHLQVNLPAGDYYRLQQRAADSDFISQVLCVTADHNPSLGRSYPGELDVFS